QYYIASFSAIAHNSVHLDSLTRDIQIGHPMLFDIDRHQNTPAPQLVRVTNYQETVWYANPDRPTRNPSIPPKPPTPAIPITHSVIGFSPSLHGNWEKNKKSAMVRYAWQDVGQLIGTPTATFSPALTVLKAFPPAVFPQRDNLPQLPVLVEDADSQGV